MASWPAGLPSPLAEGVTYQPYDHWLRSATETGPGKQRLRFTGTDDKMSFTLTLLPDQYDAFWAWFDGAPPAGIGRGILPFDWKNFRTGAACSYKFTKRPSEAYVAGDADVGDGWWKLSIELETV